MTTIIVPTAIVTGMGLIAAVILTVASKLMYVPVDERVAAIREVLPGANCGACGFAGCDDYAAAFTDNPGLSCSLCPVGGASVASQIAGIMGEEASAAEPQVAMVMCQGSFGVTREIMEDDRITSCKEAKMFYGGQWACRFGCLGLGDCYNVCKFDAITVDNGVAKINIDTDLRLAMTSTIREFFIEHPEKFDPREYMGPGRTAVKEMVMHKMRDVLGTAGHAKD